MTVLAMGVSVLMLLTAAGLAASTARGAEQGLPWKLIAIGLAIGAAYLTWQFVDIWRANGAGADPVSALLALAGSLATLCGIGLLRRLMRKFDEARRVAERERRRIQGFADAASDWYWEMGPDLRFTYFSDRLNEIIGRPADEDLGLSRAEVIDGGSQNELWRQHLDDLAKRRPFRDFRYTRPHHDGRTLTVSVSGRPLYDSDGQFQGYVGVGSDLTAQLAVEAQARAADERLAAAIDAVDEPIVLWDDEDRLVLANRAFWSHNQAATGIRTGMRYRDFAEALLAARLVPEAFGREREWLEERLRQRADPGAPFEQQRTNGSWTIIREQRLPDGGLITMTTDITSLKQAEHLLSESEQRLRDYASVAAHWFWEQDQDLRFTTVSAGGQNLTGRSNSDLLGKTRRETGLEGVSEADLTAHEAQLEAREPFDDFRFAVRRPDGQQVHLSISGRPVFDPQGRFRGYRGAGRDITAFIAAQRDLRAERDRAEAANRAKSDFLANMSHELRTPLNAIIGFADVMHHGMLGDLSPRYRGYAGDIVSSGQHLLDLINELLDLARIESGQHELRESLFPLAEELAEVVTMLQPQGEKKQLRMRDNLASLDRRQQLRADRRAFRQILINLISNAIKFTEPGGRIDVQAETDGTDLTIRVTDTGIGIPATEIDRVFDRFAQVGATATRGHDGIGIGLALCHDLATLHGGDIQLESTLGEGTSATLLLPDRLQHVAPASAGASAESEAAD